MSKSKFKVVLMFLLVFMLSFVTSCLEDATETEEGTSDKGIVVTFNELPTGAEGKTAWIFTSDNSSIYSSDSKTSVANGDKLKIIEAVLEEFTIFIIIAEDSWSPYTDDVSELPQDAFIYVLENQTDADQALTLGSSDFQTFEDYIGDVTVPEETEVFINKSTLALKIDAEGTLSAEVTPSSESQDVLWTSSDESVATVSSSGTVKAKTEGTAWIIVAAYYDQDKKDSCKVTVTKDAPVVEIAVELNKSTLSLDVDSSKTLTATVSPSSEDQSVTWSSNDKTVATVSSSGEVKGVGVGSALIIVTADAKSDAKDTCEVEVTKSEPGTIDAPTDFEVKKAFGGDSITTTKIYLTWNAAKYTKLDGFYVYLSTDSDTGFEKVSDEMNGMSTLKDLKPGTMYYFYVTAYEAELGESEKSEVLSAQTLFEKPGQVSGASIKRSEDAFIITWDSATKADSYVIFRSSQKYADGDSVGAVNDTVFKDSYADLKADTTYYYTVRALNKGGLGEASKKMESYFVRAPENLAATVDSTGITLTWDTPDASKNQSYTIYRSDNADSGFVEVKSIYNINLRWLDEDVVSGNSYYYTITWDFGMTESIKATPIKVDFP
ncbi:MAG: Ig-like domain-containing protein [Fibrobacteria bacterium]|nr:Ig-like domain-containing protein [Fibrobacteria bacterium]